jgi:hypothetical protein
MLVSRLVLLLQNAQKSLILANVHGETRKNGLNAHDIINAIHCNVILESIYKLCSSS